MDEQRKTTPCEAACIVDSRLHPLALRVHAVLTRSARNDEILIDDEENVLRALEARVSIRAVLHSGEALPEELTRRLPGSVRGYAIGRATCKKLFGADRVSRTFAIARTPAALGLDALVAVPQDIVVLEGVSIMGNVGAVIRTSRALGIGGIVVLDTDPGEIYDRRLIRASRGYLFSMPVVTATTDELLRHCRRHDLELLVTTPRASTSVRQIARDRQRLVFAFGSEKEGCSEALTRAASRRVRIPTLPGVDSLNVSAAAAIVLYTRLGHNRVEVACRSGVRGSGWGAAARS